MGIIAKQSFYNSLSIALAFLIGAINTWADLPAMNLDHVERVNFLQANNQDLINNIGNLTTLSQKGAMKVGSIIFLIFIETSKRLLKWHLTITEMKY